MAFMDKLGRFLEGAMGGVQEGVGLRQSMNREQRAQEDQFSQRQTEEEARIRGVAQYNIEQAQGMIQDNPYLSQGAGTALGMELGGQRSKIQAETEGALAEFGSDLAGDLTGVTTLEGIDKVQEEQAARLKGVTNVLSSTFQAGDSKNRQELRDIQQKIQAGKDKFSAYKQALNLYNTIDSKEGFKVDDDGAFYEAENALLDSLKNLLGDEQQAMTLFNQQKSVRQSADYAAINSIIDVYKTTYGGKLDRAQATELLGELDPIFKRNPGLLMNNEALIQGMVEANDAEAVTSTIDLMRLTNLAGSFSPSVAEDMMKSASALFLQRGIDPAVMERQIIEAVKMSKVKKVRTESENTALLQNALRIDQADPINMAKGISPMVAQVFIGAGLTEIGNAFLEEGGKRRLTVDDYNAFNRIMSAQADVYEKPKEAKPFQQIVSDAWYAGTSDNTEEGVNRLNTATDGPAAKFRNIIINVYDKIDREIKFPDASNRGGKLIAIAQMEEFNRGINRNGYYYDPKTKKFYALDDEQKKAVALGEVITGDQPLPTPEPSANIRDKTIEDMYDTAGSQAGSAIGAFMPLGPPK
jgi:ElaB/YqjD/DUF883 family membrane-anchored ribosome-binding protein